MQIDFHHAATYVAARLAGFPHDDADIIAHAAQYVDDATCDGAIKFDNKAIYKRISSSHKAIDFQNFDPVEDLLVWMPFHFLPGNGGADSADNPEGTFIHKLVTLPDSPVAQEMVRSALLDHDKPYSLHRLGITMHVYADTWAHQGFAGVLDDINDVEDFDELDDSGVFEGGLNGFISSVLDDVVPPLGHGRANVFPDMPFLSWKYKNGHGTEVTRNNTDIFCKAANALCKAMKRYRLKDPDAMVTGIDDGDMKQIRKLFADTKNEDGEDRHREWLKALEQGLFSFGPATISYAEDGKGSWKVDALGTSRDMPKYPYNGSFLTSNWKRFHDALQLHRITISHDILPKYGICAA
jgi:hypothetical protein